MLKKISLIAVAAILALSPLAAAEEVVKGLGTDYLTGANHPRTGRVELSLFGGSDSFDINLDEGGYGEIGLSVGILPQFAIGASVGYHGDSVTNQGLVDYYAITAYMDFILRLPLDQFPLNHVAVERGWWDSLVPYFKWSFGRHGFGINDESTGGDSDFSTESADRFAVGLDWFVNPKVALFIEWASHSNDPVVLDSSSLSGQNLDFDVFGGGVKVVF